MTTSGMSNTLKGSHHFAIMNFSFIQVISALGNRNCSVRYPYTGQVCLRELQAQQDRCSSNSSQDLITTTAENQVDLEQHLTILLNSGLNIFNSSPECVLGFRSFLCDRAFGSCDSTLSSRDKCRNVRDSLCTREWLEIESFIGGLPVCEDLPEGTAQVSRVTDSEVTAVSTVSTVSSPSCNESSVDTPTQSNPLNCSEFFFFHTSNNLCLPICGWSPHLDRNTDELNIALSAIGIVGLLLFSSINLLSAVTVQRHTL